MFFGEHDKLPWSGGIYLGRIITHLNGLTITLETSSNDWNYVYQRMAADLQKLDVEHCERLRECGYMEFSCHKRSALAIIIYQRP